MILILRVSDSVGDVVEVELAEANGTNPPPPPALYG